MTTRLFNLDDGTFSCARVETRADIASITRFSHTSFSTADGARWKHGTVSGPMAIQDASGQYWELDLTLGYVHAKWFGAVGDGVTDDTAALNAASTAINAIGGGSIDITGGRYLIDSADLVLLQYVNLIGPNNNFGEIANHDYTNLKSSLIVNSSYTVRLYKFAGIKGINIFRKGLTAATATVRWLYDMKQAFAGTAVTIGDGTGGTASDVYIGYTFICGFMQAIYGYNNERPHIEYVSGDCTNGIYLKTVTDMNHLSHCHFWSFLTTHMVSTSSFAVTNAVNNGSGLIRLSCTYASFQVGDIVVVNSVTGTLEANGRWTIAAVGSGYIDLAGSAFVNAYVSGGNIVLAVNKRFGVAYKFSSTVDWGQISDCFSYGYDYGFLIDSSNDVVLVNCGADGNGTEGDPTTIGYLWQNNALRGTMIGCKGASHGYGVQYDVGSANNSNASSSLSILGSHFWQSTVSHVYLKTGRMTLTNNFLENMFAPAAATRYAITVEGTSYGIVASGNSCTYGTPITFTSGGTALSRSMIRLNRWADPSSTGTRENFDNSQRAMYLSAYGSSTSVSQIFQNARGSINAPTKTQASDNLYVIRGQGYDSTGFFDSTMIRSIADGVANTGSTPGKIIFSTTPASSTSVVDRVSIDHLGNVFPVTDNASSLGTTGHRWSQVWAANGTIQTSDSRDKINVKTSSLGLDFIKELNPVSFQWKYGTKKIIKQEWVRQDGSIVQDGEEIPDDAMLGKIITYDETPSCRTQWGLIAQEVKTACDNAGVDFGGWILSDQANSDSKQALIYSQFISPMIKAIQDLSDKVAILESKIS